MECARHMEMGGGGHAVGLLLCAVQKPEGTPAPSNPDEIGSGTGLQLQLNKTEAAASILTALLAGAMSCHRGVFRKKIARSIVRCRVLNKPVGKSFF